MSVPRRRLSKARTGQRKAGKKSKHYSAGEACSDCGKPRFSHRACMFCGLYKSGIRISV
ncbi:MAG: 50S ribosomal protein L32 [Chlamydiia bacterium]|nr:50S ribosomal protein L32 [Chlamydiia bacterium]